ncbi:P-loop containing nucleoside triphosphate hydrolase protein [Chytridium lagenaria]|nr:P-loop containing nucleoside triphosphate hydrolase protein [Chytridium lagenaria]
MASLQPNRTQPPSPFAPPPPSSPSPSSSSTAVTVALRIRPYLIEIESQTPKDRERSLPLQTATNDRSLSMKETFHHDRVFAGRASQRSVYTACVRSLVEKFITGYNVTVMAYGQTGSGKTYTMGSSREYVSLNQTSSVDDNRVRIIARSIKDVFSLLKESSKSYSVSATFLEVYNEELTDLLSTQPASSRTPIIIQETGSGTAMSGCNVVKLNSSDDALRVLIVANLRYRYEHLIIPFHAIFTLTLVQDIQSSRITSRFHFVDLAGSERMQRTGSVSARQREGIHINSGLLALGNVISALADESGRVTHVPYRDSKLTRVLQDSLGGNSNTLMIACISPTENDLSETLNTLKYANRARKVRNVVSINKDVPFSYCAITIAS